MGFKEIRAILIRCLKNGQYDHEIRGDMEIKNCLFNGNITVNEVIDMALVCTGNDYEQGKHHAKPSLVIHILKPKGKYKGWYIKFHYLDPETIFLSVHN